MFGKVDKKVEQVQPYKFMDRVKIVNQNSIFRGLYGEIVNYNSMRTSNWFILYFYKIRLDHESRQLIEVRHYEVELAQQQSSRDDSNEAGAMSKGNHLTVMASLSQ